MILKKFIKLFVVALSFAVGITLLSPDLLASAKTNDENELVTDQDSEIKIDLSNGNTQESTYVDENGTKVTFGAEPELEDNEGVIMPLSTETLPSGTSKWHIYWYSGAVNMSYHIKVKRTSSSTKILDAYDLSVSSFGYSLSDTSFTHTSKKAEYSATATIYTGLFSLNVYLKASVSGKTLTIKAKA
ncbi:MULTISPECIES: DUF5626 family protein [Rummeliibacillus]|uniref:DUF5626 family protein n=1 Tax=Rummeliibacillus TaxID=648802 RepID=UPI0011B4AF2E|nr:MULTISPECIES: DUF5626 family protein [Rummeliibacillus]